MNLPEKYRPAADGTRGVGNPVAHIEGVRHDTRSRSELVLQLRSQPKIDRFTEIERDDGRVTHVGFKEILTAELDAVAHAGLFGERHRLLNAGRIQLDPDAALRPEVLD